MGAGFTPGPWEWNEGGRLFHNVPASHSENVLVVHDPVWRPTPADARLIAAAPELFAACERAESWLQDDILGNADDPQETLAAIVDALAKARGEQ